MNFRNIMTRTVFISFLLCVVVASIEAQETVTPQEAITLTLENNYGIKIANNAVELAANNKDILNSGYLPVLSGNGGATYNQDNLKAEFASGETTELNGAESSRYNASISLDYLLFDGLGRYYNYKQLKEEYNLSELEARQTIELTIVQLLSVYYDVSRQSENVNSLQETLAISKERLTRAEYQFEYGQNTKLDVLNAEVDINNDSINIINARQNLINAKRDLNVVTSNAIPEQFEIDTTVTFLEGLDKEQLMAKTLANNVSLLQAEQNIIISEFSLKASRSGYLPAIGLFGTYGWNENNNNAASFVAVSTNTGVSAGVSLSWNLFDGGSTITRVKNSKILLENQRLIKEDIKLDVQRDFNNAWTDYKNKLNIFYIQEDNIRTARNNFQRTEEQFRLGQVTSIIFRQAQLNLLSAELTRNQAKYEAKLAEVVVLQLSGELLNVNIF
ncbi:TolC family protein [Winogradskyella aurantiaca]|uniref:TolC family protein n=1 Tax=Winogradskyella aurantiaca TaxID=2219558 RepID=UPI001E4C62D1|nr:TolC family protein [Winogradskyella aurantiaca]